MTIAAIPFDPALLAPRMGSTLPTMQFERCDPPALPTRVAAPAPSAAASVRK